LIAKKLSLAMVTLNTLTLELSLPLLNLAAARDYTKISLWFEYGQWVTIA